MISKAKIKFILYAGSAVILALLAYGAVMACWDFCDGSALRHEREGRINAVSAFAYSNCLKAITTAYLRWDLRDLVIPPDAAEGDEEKSRELIGLGRVRFGECVYRGAKFWPVSSRSDEWPNRYRLLERRGPKTTYVYVNGSGKVYQIEIIDRAAKGTKDDYVRCLSGLFGKEATQSPIGFKNALIWVSADSSPTSNVVKIEAEDCAMARQALKERITP